MCSHQNKLLALIKGSHNLSPGEVHIKLVLFWYRRQATGVLLALILDDTTAVVLCELQNGSDLEDD